MGRRATRLRRAEFMCVPGDASKFQENMKYTSVLHAGRAAKEYRNYTDALAAFLCVFRSIHDDEVSAVLYLLLKSHLKAL